MRLGRLVFAIGFAVASVALAAPRTGSNHWADWPGHGGRADEQAYSALEQINTANVKRLGLAWSLDLPGERELEATPLAIHGVLYFTGGYAKVYAVDAVRGTLLWTYDPQVRKLNSHKSQTTLPVNRGLAYADGRLFFGTVDGRLIALDAKAGALLWSAQTTPAASYLSITGAPRAFNGKVIIGAGGADWGERGYVTAYDQATGKQVWRFYVAPGSPDQNRGDPAMEQAASTWDGEFWEGGTGGGPWDSLTFDEPLNRIYVATGNATPDENLRKPGGDKLYTASIVALDADTGRYVWHYQLNPRDIWDYDSTQQMTLADLVIDGAPRKVLIQAPKNGFLYVLDRATGKLISAGKIGKVTWAKAIDPVSGRPVETPDARGQAGGAIDIWPAQFGAHSWQTMSFSPKTGLVYIPYMQLGMRYAANNGGAAVPFTTLKVDPEDGKGALVAYDPVRQTVAWKVQHAYLWNGGAMATGGGLVFQGAADGALSAYDASSGQRLWRFDAGLGIIAAPITYVAGGRQYVSVLVGYGASNSLGDVMNAGWKYGAQPRRLLTFALDGKAVLPPTPGPDFSVHAVDDPKVQIDPADVAAGEWPYFINCAACHGLNAVSAGAPAPDLRESSMAVHRETLWAVVHDGALEARGMPAFTQLDGTQVRQIHAFIRAKAREALAKQASAPGR